MLAAPLLLRGYGLLASSMLAPAGHAELTRRVQRLTETRTDALDTEAAEIRRIERDLHDGAQALMAEGRSNAAIAQRLAVTERAVAKHTASSRCKPGTPRPGRTCAATSIFLKLDPQPSDDDNRRLLAVLAYLGG